MVETQNQNIVLNKIYHPIQKKYISQNVKDRRAKQISVMLPPAGLIMFDLYISNDLTFE
jgi:hypothetical protein